MPATTSPLIALRFSGRLMVIQNACPRFASITLLSVIAPLTQSRGPVRASLLDAPPLEKSGVGRVLLDIGRVALLRQIDIFVHLRRILADLGIVAGALMATIGRRYRRHFIVA